MQLITQMIPPKAKKIMEFSCGAGNIAQEFKHIQPFVYYAGCEFDEEKLVLAKKHMDFVFKGSFEEKIPGFIEGEIDTLVYHGSKIDFSCVAEYMKAHISYLNDNGCIVFELENTSYFRNILSVWQGKSPVSKSLFCLDDMIKIFEGNGLQIDFVKPVYRKEDDLEKQSEPIQVLINAFIGYCKDRHISVKTDMWAEKYIIRAVKAERKSESLIIQTVIGESHACARVRILEPHIFCSTIPGVVSDDRELTADLNLSRFYADKVLIRQRMTALDPRNLEEFMQVLNLGYLLIYEIDDHPLLWKKRYEKLRFADFTCCHAVQVSTEPLADFMRQFNPNVVVFKNQLTYLPERRIFVENEKITVFFGAVNRQLDWEKIMPLINNMIKKYGERLHFKVMYDKNFYQQLQTENKEMYEGFCSYELYEKVLHDSDIALLPLEDTAFNRMKSDLKFIECAGHGVVVIASPTVYKNSVRNGRTGFIYHNSQEFEEMFSLLVDNPVRRMETAYAAYEYVKTERLLANHYEERYIYYKKLMKNKEIITEKIKKQITILKSLI